MNIPFSTVHTKTFVYNMKPSRKSKTNKCCLEKCKQKGKYTTDMLRCCSCNIWCHYECVGEDPATPGIWNCHECSQAGNILHSLAQDMLFIKEKISNGFISLDTIPEQIKNLNKRVDDLTNEVKSLQTTNTQLISELTEQHKLNSDLKRINTELESKIAQNYQDKEDKLSSNQSCKLLIGSSIIRDIVPTDTQKIKVCSHSGASVQDITRALDKEKFQNRSARIVCKLYDFAYSGLSLVKSNGSLNVRHRRDFLYCTLIHKCIYGIAPNYLSDNLTLYDDVQSSRITRQSTQLLLHVPFVKHSFCQKSFSVYGPFIWNTLPPRNAVILFYLNSYVNNSF